MIEPKAVIAEDEENLRIGLITLLQKLWPELRICGEAETGKEALDIIKREQPDFVFLDIRMPEVSGLEVAKQIDERSKIVFVTAYDKYAVQAFESEAIDYLLKPVTEERLEKTIARLKKRLASTESDADLDGKMTKIIQLLESRQSSEQLRLIKVKSGTAVRFVPVSQVYFFKAEDKYTIVQTAQDEFIIRTPIKDLEQNLDADRFWRVHRSAIVNVDKIHKIKRSFTNSMVITFLNMEKTVNVSRVFEHLFRHM